MDAHLKASFLAASSPHTGDWLLALPITSQSSSARECIWSPSNAVECWPLKLQGPDATQSSSVKCSPATQLAPTLYVLNATSLASG